VEDGVDVDRGVNVTVSIRVEITVTVNRRRVVMVRVLVERTSRGLVTVRVVVLRVVTNTRDVSRRVDFVQIVLLTWRRVVRVRVVVTSFVQ
jgi:hypothetical protein